MSECPQCHAQNLPNSIYCDECGCKLAEVGKEAISAAQVSPAKSESISEVTQLQPIAQSTNSTAVSVAPSEPSPQLTLPTTSSSKAALPTASSQVLKSNLLKRNAAQETTTSKIGNFFSSLVNGCQKITSSGSSLLKNLGNSDANQSNEAPLKSPLTPDSNGKTLGNKIAAALLGIGILALCIFMIGKKLAIFSLSTFIKEK